MNNFVTKNILKIGLAEDKFIMNYKNSNACTICAIATSMNKSWEDTFSALSRLCKKKHCLPNTFNVFGEYLIKHGYSLLANYRRLDCNGDIVYETKDNNTIAYFLHMCREGNYIIWSKNHMFCYIDGVIYDSKSNIENFDKRLSDQVYVIFKKKEEEK